ncbi:hypothetical protein L195_g032219 [Trifolium pratense]|uniref:FAR1-related protein n=1 Tax=Trifolium pratense TaxID=57577 RepID=A0A2K3LCP8_TRIPR|nr:hypothetical protein L195_g032219 [Trifolium pratense]
MLQNVSRKAVKCLVAEVAQVEDVGTDKSKCGCLNKTPFGLTCACSLAKTIKEDIIDVVGDMHYGFRVVSRLLGKSPNGHNIICLEFTIELNKNRAQHLDIFGSQQRNDVIKNALTTVGTDVAHEDKCMMMHDIGFLLAQKYKHVVVLLAGNKGFSKMYFPLEGDPTSKERLVYLGWVNGNHFLVIHS